MTNEHPADGEIEITDEMVDAGFWILRGNDALDVLADGTLQEIVCEVYAAMVRVGSK